MSPETKDAIIAIVFAVCALAVFGGLPWFAHLIAPPGGGDVEKPDDDPEVPRWTL